MKNVLNVFLISLIFLSINISRVKCQEPVKKQIVFYSFFVNVVPDNFNIPLIGFVNTALGTHKGLQLGYVNTTLGDFTGGQIGFVNTNLKSTTGAQIGFVNTSIKEVKGSQIGYVNTTLKDFQGTQIGFVNTTIDDSKGPQVGFVNFAAKSLDGVQIAYVNATGKTLNGFQLGFVNYVDSIAKGIPVGFVSVVRKGGYRAFEFGFNEVYPLNVSFRIGVPQFYTFFTFAAKPGTNSSYASGMGMGTTINLKDALFMNVEASSVEKIGRDNELTNQVSILAGYNFSERISVYAGPGFTHQYKDTFLSPFDKPLFSMFEYKINPNNRLLMGLHAGLRIRI